jgi:hypothetical protein
MAPTEPDADGTEAGGDEGAVMINAVQIQAPLLHAGMALCLFSLSCTNPPPVHQARRDLAGEWVSVERPFPYTAELLIGDTSFQFWYGACTQQGSSNGNLQYKGDTIVLTSAAPVECRWLVPFDVDGHYTSTGLDSLPSVRSTPSIPDCEPNYFAEEEVEFNEDRFIILSDTLVHVSRHAKVHPFVAHRFVRVADTVQAKGGSEQDSENKRE